MRVALLRHWILCGGLAAALSFATPARSQAPPQRLAQTAGDAELKRLREELKAAREENARLREENARLRQQLDAPEQGRAAAAPSATAAGRNEPMAWPAVDLSKTVTVDELIRRYRLDAIGADAQFKGKTFRLEGTVDRMEPPFAGLTYTVYLRGSDSISRIKCKVKFPGISDLALSSDGKMLSGARPFRKMQPLLSIGETVVFEGRCDGVRDSTVEFEKCRPAELGVSRTEPIRPSS